MFFVSLLAGLTLSVSAETCPNLTGWYACFGDGEIWTERFSQEVVNGVTVYTNEVVKAKPVESQDENGQPKIEYVPETKIYTYPADNQAYPANEDNFDGTTRANCENGSLMVYVLGTFLKDGAPDFKADTAAKLTVTSESYETEYSGSFFSLDGVEHKMPEGARQSCTRTGSR